MINNNRVLAIIPARSGSKGLPGKNVKEIAGKPLIAWSIIEAKKSEFIDRLIVSTDSKEIADIALQYEAEIPFIRPKNLALDTSKCIDVIYHSIKSINEKYEIVMILQPTSPLRNKDHIDKSIKLMFELNAKAIVSISELEHPVQWIGKIPINLNMENFTQSIYRNSNRQELEKHYRYNGAIYISFIDYLYENNGFIGKDTFAYIMNKEDSIDIDDYFDFKIAELFLKEK